MTVDIAFIKQSRRIKANNHMKMINNKIRNDQILRLFSTSNNIMKINLESVRKNFASANVNYITQ